VYYSKIFEEKIDELAKINDLIINLYDINGEFLTSSHMELYTQGLLPQKANVIAIEKLRKHEDRIVIEEKLDKEISLSAYSYITNIEGLPLAILNLPYYTSDETNRREVKDFLISLSAIYIVLLPIGILIAFMLSNYITRSLKLISGKIKTTNISQKNEAIRWEADDEVGALIKEYNRMVLELEESARLLAKSERESAWREMAKQVAHEIKNPLTPMKLNVQQLEKAWNDKADNFPNRIERFTKLMVEQIDTLSNIAGEFSNFAQMPKSSYAVVNINELLENVVALYNEAGNTSIKLITSQNEMQVLADKEQLMRVFQNLIKNAIQAIPEDRVADIQIHVQAVSEYITITFSDNGTGIAPEIQEKLFQPNFTTKSMGMGLGLSMAKTIIENAGGSIGFKTEQNKGTAFYVQLPQA